VIYEYECKSCQTVTEIEHSISDDSDRFCEKCGQKLKRLISGGTSFLLKGEGWHRDLYSKKS
jgi:putative FmdB family regulatory protein